MNYCPNCGSALKDNPTYCPNCGQKLINTTNKVEEQKISGEATSQLKCPKCGSENVQKYTLWKKSHKHDSSGAAEGVGCLIVIVLLIFAPIAVLVLGIALVITLPTILGVGLIAAIAYAIQQSYESNRYICLKCEHNFNPKELRGKGPFDWFD
ncbi:MAG: zinc ribbon domain-containing protein [Dehalococcoidia bacterium]|jgi:predicted RNA-binding Zn-ribbon protein involved in translation (DUF1610 family)